MDFNDSPEEAAFRAELRAWLDEHVGSAGPATNDDQRREQMAEWHRLLYSGGWMGLSWPEEVGGRGLALSYEAILNDEVGRAGAPPVPGVGFLGRAILDYGTGEQSRRLLPTLLSGDVRWCQGFSEPDAGSDLANMRTRAERFGDEYRVYGQKIWTSGARWADRCLLLARTDPGQSRHRGISCLVVDMHADGVEVRPIVQISGDRDFAEVYFDDVKVPVADRIGEENAGWQLAMRTLTYERGLADTGVVSRFLRVLHDLDDAAAEGRLRKEVEFDAQLARLRVRVEVLRVHSLRSLSRRMNQGPEGVEGSIDKIFLAQTEQQLHRLALDAMGSRALLGGEDRGDWLFGYLFSRAATVYGGSVQIQRNILAERALGLPVANAAR
jgi:alkylation response protein AidB-like acyl-CoA dehydrogenase